MAEPVEKKMNGAPTRTPGDGHLPSGLPGSSRAWEIFMLVAMLVAIFYLISFMIRFPEYWIAALLFLIIAVVGVIRRIAVLRGWKPNIDISREHPDN